MSANIIHKDATVKRHHAIPWTDLHKQDITGFERLQFPFFRFIFMFSLYLQHRHLATGNTIPAYFQYMP